MHPNPVFRKTEIVQNLAFARDRSFGTLSINAEDGPLIAHVPFQVSDDGRYLEAHLVRSNPIARTLKEPQKAVVAVSGGDGYISPDWYGVPDQVPTWNYVAVHLTGTLSRLPQDTMREMLDRQSAAIEEQLLPKTPWKTDKMTPEVLESMMRMISYRSKIPEINYST